MNAISIIRILWAPLSASLGTYFFLLLAQPPNDSPEFAYFFLLPALAWFSFEPKLKVVLASFLFSGFLYYLSLVGWMRHVTVGGMLGACSLLSIYNLPWFFTARLVVPIALRSGFKIRIISIFGLSCVWISMEWFRCQFTLGFPWCPLSVTQFKIRIISIFGILHFRFPWLSIYAWLVSFIGYPMAETSTIAKCTMVWKLDNLFFLSFF